MKLITKLEIVGLRSIRDQSIENIGSMNTFVGKNSSGKSNVLRALNLFFNREVDQDSPLNFPRDHYEQEPKIKKKKRISVTAHFDLPAEFKIRAGLPDVQALGKKFSITRAWELDPRLNPIEEISVSVDGKRVEDGQSVATQFLSLINYRYIPNYINPVQLLGQESREIAGLVLSRLKADTHAAALLDSLATSSERVLSNADVALKAAGSPLSAPTIFSGNHLAEFLTTQGFQAQGAHGLPVADSDWGSGHQSFFMYQVLNLLDTNYSMFFGWRQATIWGLEEPETSLHRDLETRLAGVIRDWCDTPSSKFQVFITSHSSVFLTASESGYVVDLPEKETEIQHEDIGVLVKKAESLGVTPWMHPVLSFPFNPVVLVEGPIDVAILSHIANLTGLAHIRFVTTPRIDPDEAKGKDGMLPFLRHASKYIPNRSGDCPLMVLFDWDVSQQEIEKNRKAYGRNGENAYSAEDDRLFRRNVTGYSAGSALDVFLLSSVTISQDFGSWGVVTGLVGLPSARV